MAVVYPLTLPSVPAPQRTSFALRRSAVVNESPFTGEQQVLLYPLALWTAQVTLPPMRRDRAAAWTSFFISCKGRFGTFLMGDYDARLPRGTARTAVMSGNHAAGVSGITLRGMGANTTLLEGDFIQVGSGLNSRLHMVVTGGNGSNSSGVAAFNIEPPLKAAVPDGAAVNLVNPVGLWRLDVSDPGWDSDQVSLYSFSFSCTEAF